MATKRRFTEGKKSKNCVVLQLFTICAVPNLSQKTDARFWNYTKGCINVIGLLIGFQSAISYTMYNQHFWKAMKYVRDCVSWLHENAVTFDWAPKAMIMDNVSTRFRICRHHCLYQLDVVGDWEWTDTPPVIYLPTASTGVLLVLLLFSLFLVNSFLWHNSIANTQWFQSLVNAERFSYILDRLIS